MFTDRYKGIEKVYHHHESDNVVECDICQGHGRFNLFSTQPGFYASTTCWKCHGVGWLVGPHEHKYLSKDIGKCLRRDTCVICGKEVVVDSSD